ncbi:hypothetical protein GOODEAATRI_013084, partial [Goodea atripinnis]
INAPLPNHGYRGPKLCPCGNKMSSWDTHPVCLGVVHASTALTSTEECIYCASFPRKLLRRRLARQVSLSGRDPVMCGSAMLEGEAAVEPLATPGPSWADADPQLMPSALPVLQTDQVCDGLAISQSFPEGDGNEDRAESDDSELMLSDDEDEESTVLVSCVKLQSLRQGMMTASLQRCVPWTWMCKT